MDERENNQLEKNTMRTRAMIPRRALRTGLPGDSVFLEVGTSFFASSVLLLIEN